MGTVADGYGGAQEPKGPPAQQPNTTPPQYGLDPGNLMALQTAIEMQKSLGGIEAKVDRLIDDVAGLSKRLGEVETAVERVRTSIIVASVILTAVGGVFWWALGDRISTAVQLAITETLKHTSNGQGGAKP